MKVLRWIAILPVSLLALILASFVLKITMSLSGLETESILSQCAIGLACGVAFIYAGVYISPSHRIKVALTLLIIGMILSIINLYIINFIYFTYRDNFREVFAIIGAVVTYLIVKGNKGQLDNL